MFLRQSIVLTALVLVSFSRLQAEDLVPDSTSPNGKFAIFYEPSTSTLADSPPQVWFVNLRTHQHISAQLVPSDKLVEKEAYRNHHRWALADDRQMLWETIVEGIDEQREGRRGAVNTSVTWNDHSQRVAVRVNDHKFTHTSVFRLRRGRFCCIRDCNE